MNEIPLLTKSNLLIILKCFKNVSTSANTLVLLYQSRLIDHVCRILEQEQRSFTSPDLQNQALSTLYLLCRINAGGERQKRAIECGAVPRLQYFIEKDSPLKQL